MTMRNTIAAFLTALVLGACQTTAPNMLSADAGMKLTRLGFTKTDLPVGLASTPGARTTGIYICRKEQCGRIVVVMTAAFDSLGPSMAPITYESAVRSGAYNEDGVRRLYQQLFDGHYEKKAQIESVRIDRRNAVMMLRVRISDDKKSALAVFNIRVRGNAGEGIVAISDQAAISARYANLRYLD